MDIYLIARFCFGPLILLLAIIFRVFPPRKINNLYGYRTARSMKTQETWDEANQYSFNLMIIAGVLATMLQVVFYFTLTQTQSLIASPIVIVFLLVIITPITERHLRKNFDDSGRRKNAD